MWPGIAHFRRHRRPYPQRWCQFDHWWSPHWICFPGDAITLILFSWRIAPDYVNGQTRHLCNTSYPWLQWGSHLTPPSATYSAFHVSFHRTGAPGRPHSKSPGMRARPDPCSLQGVAVISDKLAPCNRLRSFAPSRTGPGTVLLGSRGQLVIFEVDSMGQFGSFAVPLIERCRWIASLCG